MLTSLLSIFSLLCVPYFIFWSHFIFSVPMRKYRGEHSCMSSAFPLVMNVTCSPHPAKLNSKLAKCKCTTTNYRCDSSENRCTPAGEDGCSLHRSCESCQDAVGCGWCDDGTGTGTGACMSGGATGTRHPVTGVPTLATCPHHLWYFTTCPGKRDNIEMGFFLFSTVHFFVLKFTS